VNTGDLKGTSTRAVTKIRRKLLRKIYEHEKRVDGESLINDLHDL
jgi:hypothetical protein